MDQKSNTGEKRDVGANEEPVSLELKDRALAAAAEGITIADIREPDQPLIYANEGFERLTLYSVDEVLGRNCRFLQGADTDPEVVREIRSAIAEKRECTVEILNYRKDGTRFWNRLSLTPVRDPEGRTTHYIGVQTDTTARREAEDALRKVNLNMKLALEAAAKIQQSLLPRSLPDLEKFHFSWVYEPTDELAGDTLNVFPLNPRKVALYTLDVSGHGVSAALLSVTLSHWLSPDPGRSSLTTLTEGGAPSVVPPRKVAEDLNRQFPMDLETAQYFTILYGVLDVETGEFRYVSAGSPPAILCRKGEAPRFEYLSGYPIGMVPEPAYQEHSLNLHPGDRLYLYTDGIPEAMNLAGEDFGMERFVSSLQKSANLSLDESLTFAVDQIREWSSDAGLQDDATILGVEFLEG